MAFKVSGLSLEVCYSNAFGPGSERLDVTFKTQNT